MEDTIDSIRLGAADAIWDQIALNRDVSFFAAIQSGAEMLAR